MKYESINEYSDEEIMNILYYGTIFELRRVSLSVGEYHQNCRFAQDVCFYLLNNQDEEVRANAVLGLSYIARRFSELNVVKLKMYLAQLNNFNKHNTERVIYALEDISLYLNEKIEWHVDKHN